MKIKAISAALLCTTLALVFVFKPAKAETQKMTYDVFASGFHVLDAHLTMTIKDNDYDLTLGSSTHGFLQKFAPWSGEFKSNGKIRDGKAYPLRHSSSSTWKKETEQKTYTYDGDGNFKSYKVSETGKDGTETDKTPKELDLQLTKDTTDILSATFNMLQQLPATKTCSGEETIFDGDRTFKLVFKETSTENLTRSKYNLYQGTAISCQVEVVPDKGKWRKKPRGWLSIQEQGRKKGQLPKIWLGKIKEAHTWVPVKILVRTEYGALFMHMTEYQLDDNPALKLKSN